MTMENTTSAAAANDNTLIAADNGYLIYNTTLWNDIATCMLEPDFRFDTIRNPAVGGNTFEITNDDGKQESVREVVGVILNAPLVNMYYAQTFDGGEGKPPNCASMDGITGIGVPGGKCAVCPHNTYQTDSKGKTTKECKNKYRLFLLQEGNYLPTIMHVTASNLNAFRMYRTKQMTKGKPLHMVITSISIDRKGGKQYAAFEFRRVRDLKPDEYAAIEPYAMRIQEYVARMAVDVGADDYETADMIDSETGEVICPLTGGADV